MSDDTANEPDERAIVERRAGLISTALRDATTSPPRLLRGGRAPAPLPCLSVAPLEPPRRSTGLVAAGFVFLVFVAGIAAYLALRLAR